MIQDTNRFMVCVECFTYNQSAFIEDTLNGFCIQETSQPYVCVICDDASTDGEPERITDYLKRYFDLDDSQTVIKKETNDYSHIFARHIKNQNCYFSVYFLKYNHYYKKPKRPYFSEWYEKSQYIAFCEGDDYWTDPMKLQIQYDYLQKHPNYSFCCHRYKIYDEISNKYLKEYGYNYYKENEDLVIDESLFLKVWVTQIMSTMIRMDRWNEVEEKRKPYSLARDVHIYYFLLKVGNGISLNREMGVYRWQPGGVAIGQSFYKRYLTAFNVYNEIFVANPDDRLLVPKIMYNGIRLLRHSDFNKKTWDVFKYLLSLESGMKVKSQLLLSLAVPKVLYESLSAIYSRWYRKKIYIK